MADNNKIETLEKDEGQIKLVKIQVAIPEADPVELNLLEFDSTDSLYQNIMILPVSSHITWFDLTDSAGNIVEKGKQIGDIANGVGPDDAVCLTLVFKKYNLKAMIDHVLRFRESVGLSQTNSLDPLGADCGIIGGGMSHDFDFNDATEDSQNADVSLEHPQIDQISAANRQSRSLDLLSLEPVLLKPTVRSLGLSVWNPVPAYNEIHNGHLLYLQLQTLEAETIHITGCTKGFYVSNSSNSRFDPSVKTSKLSSKKLAKRKSKYFHSLHPLLEHVSDRYVQTMEDNLKILQSSHPLKHVIPLQNFVTAPWLAKLPEPAIPDIGRTQMMFFNGGIDGGSLQKNWNEEYQDFIELPSSNSNDRINKERILAKCCTDFTAHVTKTVVSIVCEQIPAIEVESENLPLKDRIFLRNNVFYSFAIDANQIYGANGEAGAELAARSAVARDLTASNKVLSLGGNPIHTVLTAVVDYAGYRVVCQAPIPGAFFRLPRLELTDFDEAGALKQEYFDRPNDIVVYGIGDAVDEVKTSAVFEKAFAPLADFFHLKKHAVALKSGKKSELVGSVDIKGILGSDNRFYVIDMTRSAPQDIGFAEKYCEKGYPFKEVFLRYELVNEWVRRQLTKERSILDGNEDSVEKEDADKDEKAKEISKSLDAKIQSLKFNADAFNERSFTEVTDDIKKDQELVRSMGDFLRSTIISELVSNVAKGATLVPLDGTHLTKIVHSIGINMRCLGQIAETIKAKKLEQEKDWDQHLLEVEAANKKLEKKKAEDKAEAEKAEAEEKDSDEKAEDKETPKEVSAEEVIDTEGNAMTFYSFYRVVVQEIIARSAKFILRCRTGGAKIDYIWGSTAAKFEPSVSDIPNVIASFLSELFGAQSEIHDIISQVCLKKFCHTIDSKNIAEFIKFNKISLLREIALKFGFQLDAKQYSTEFKAEDILGVVPKIRTTISPSLIAKELESRAQNYIYQASSASDENKEKFENLAIEHYLNSIRILEQNHGKIHLSVAENYSALATICNNFNKIDQAIELSRSALIIFERCCGVDSHYVVTELLNLAYFENMKSNFQKSSKIYQKALNLLDIKFGYDDTCEDKWVSTPHPLMISTLANFAWVYQREKKLDDVVALTLKAAEISNKFNGPDCNLSAMLSRRIANVYLETEKYHESLRLYSKLLHTFKKNLGADHEATKEAKVWTERLVKYTYNTRKRA